jgi:hypothetical protein
VASSIRTTLALAALLACADHASAADLTATEQRWLAAATPAISWGLRQGLPIDIVVLPQAKAGDAPLALGWADGRCNLVFAMRGNPAAEETLAAIPAPLLDVVVEAMAAHEIAHCQRHRSGAFSLLPAGQVDIPDRIESAQPTAELKAMAHDMRVSRREEAYADLVGLAWTHAQHPPQFAAVLAWFDHERATETERGFHDTRHWLALAHAADAFADARTPFEQALAIWQRGLADD